MPKDGQLRSNLVGVNNKHMYDIQILYLVGMNIAN